VVGPKIEDSQRLGKRQAHFEKNRGFYGSEAEPFEAWLTKGFWKISEVKSGTDDEALQALYKHGLSVRDTAERTGISKSNVQRRLAIS
jgi:hypothetical protein